MDNLDRMDEENLVQARPATGPIQSILSTPPITSISSHYGFQMVAPM